MTTTIIAHLPPDQPRRLLIETFDRVYDAEAKAMTDDWKKVDHRFVDAGCLFHSYCTESRRVLISEVPLATDGED